MDHNLTPDEIAALQRAEEILIRKAARLRNDPAITDHTYTDRLAIAADGLQRLLGIPEPVTSPVVPVVLSVMLPPYQVRNLRNILAGGGYDARDSDTLAVMLAEIDRRPVDLYRRHGNDPPEDAEVVTDAPAVAIERAVEYVTAPLTFHVEAGDPAVVAIPADGCVVIPVVAPFDASKATLSIGRVGDRTP